MTIIELMERMRQVDEITLLEILEIDSNHLIDRFADIIEQKFDTLENQFDDYTPWDND